MELKELDGIGILLTHKELYTIEEPKEEAVRKLTKRIEEIEPSMLKIYKKVYGEDYNGKIFRAYFQGKTMNTFVSIFESFSIISYDFFRRIKNKNMFLKEVENELLERKSYAHLHLTAMSL